METDFITIRENQSLINLAARCKDSIENVTDFILKNLFHHELIADIPEECGLKLSEILYENGITTTGFVLKIYGGCFTEVLILMQGLEIWGKFYECPDCGCEIKYTGLLNNNVRKCINCGNEQFDHEYNPDDYRDDCVCTGIQLKEIKFYDLN